MDPVYQMLLVPKGTMLTAPTGEFIAIDDGSTVIHPRAMKLAEPHVVMTQKYFKAKFAESMEH